jgi:hypothetical protein
MCVAVEIEGEDDGGDKNVIGVTESSNMMQSLLCFVMTKKDFSDRVLVGSESLRDFTEKSLLKQAAQKWMV